MNIPSHEWWETPPAWQEFISTPMTFADIRLFFGEQGSGKSITTIACAMDDVHDYLTHIVSPEGEIIKANALTPQEQAYLETPVIDGGMGLEYNNLKHIRVFNDDGTKSKIIVKPPNYVVLSPVKIFANRTLYGVKFVPFDMEKFLSFINTPLMTNGWIILSEAILLSRKDPTSHLTKFMEMFGSECRKRHMRMAVDMQERRQLAPIFHLFAKTSVECSYDPETTVVSLDVNRGSPVMQSYDYVSYEYRQFYKSDEHMEIPQYKIDRALKAMGYADSMALVAQ